MFADIQIPLSGSRLDGRAIQAHWLEITLRDLHADLRHGRGGLTANHEQRGKPGTDSSKHLAASVGQFQDDVDVAGS